MQSIGRSIQDFKKIRR